ncbi:MAG: hypothetical protein J5859_03365 [Clostridia bacterium]|nr:hypothetical protein [Clostridia bacterium]
MNKPNADKVIFKKYFSDLCKWFAGVTVLFVITYTLALVKGSGTSWDRYWLIPACFLVIHFIMLPNYVLFFSAIVEMKKQHIVESAVLIREIERDKKKKYFNSEGAAVGKEKCVLVDTGSNKYRAVLSDRSLMDETRTSEYYKDAMVVIRYLPRSRIVLHMELDPLKETDAAAQHLFKDFHEYFI